MTIMKKTYQYLTWAAMTLSLAACTQDEALHEFDDPNAVRINATIGAVESRLAYGTDGATNFTNGDAIKVVNTKRDIGNKDAATYTLTEGTWTTTDAFIWNSGAEANNQFNAWYPATASYETFTIPAEQNTEALLAAADWMTATTEAMTKPDDCTLNLTFAHKLAKVTVNISSYGTEYGTTTPTLSEVKIYTSGGTAITPLAGTGSYTAIVTPGVAYTSTFMTLKANDVELTVKPTATLTAEGGLTAGTHYTFTLKVGKDKAIIESVTVGEWETPTNDFTDGTAEEIDYLYDESSNTYTVYNAEGLTTALTNGGNITLANGFDYTTTNDNAFSVPEGKSAVLDLNGKTLGISAPQSLSVNSDTNETIATTLTINDSVGGGGVVNENSVGWGTLHVIGSGSTLIINGGTFTGATGMVWVNGWDWQSGSQYDLGVHGGGTATVNDGTFGYVYVAEGTLTINGGYVGCIYYETLSYGIINITGGTFGFDPTQVVDGMEVTANLVDTDNYDVTKNTDADGNETWTVTAKSE